MSQHRLQKRSSWHGNLGSALPVQVLLSEATWHLLVCPNKTPQCLSQSCFGHQAIQAISPLLRAPDSKMPGIKQRLFGKYGRKKAPKAEPTHGAASSSTAPTAAKRGRKRALLEDSKLSPFGLQLKSDWLRHRQTGPGVQQYAETAEASGAQALEGLSSAGSEGSNPKNVARDLRRKLMPSTMTNGPPLYYVQDVTEGGSRHPVVLLGIESLSLKLKTS